MANRRGFGVEGRKDVCAEGGEAESRDNLVTS